MKTLSKIWSILTASERARAIGLMGLMLVSMILEMLGIGLVVPALAAMSSDQPATPSPAVAQWLAWLGNPSRQQLLLGGLLLLLLLYAFKAAFVLFVSWRQLRFVAALQERISRQLYTAYLSQPWTYHLQRNSAEMIRTLNDISPFASTCTVILGALAEMLVVLGVMGLLIWIEPVGAITVGVLMAVATYALDRTTKSRLVRWGRLGQHHMALMFKHLYQGLGGAKDVKVLGCEQDFIDQYSSHRSQMVRMHSRQTFFAQIPRLWYELLAVAGLCILTAVMFWQGKSTQAMIPTLGLFAAASFRMMPSVNRLAAAMQGLRYGQANIETIHSELALQPEHIPQAGERLGFSKSIHLENVAFRYPTGHENALDGVSLEIPHGSAIGIIGGSGAGKSTLVDVILGLLAPSAGRVTVDGVDITTDIRGWQDLIGYVPQAIYLCDDTIRRNVAFGIPEDTIDDAAVSRALRSAQLDDLIARLPTGVETIVGEQGVRLSGGQRQRIGIARALYHDPQVLVLDEATSALDTETEQGVMEAVNALHGAKTLIIVAHRFSTIANCDRIYSLDRGRIAKTGTYAEVVTG
jgi:ABC-type multidrug transport system fused ATPase/permease subunit